MNMKMVTKIQYHALLAFVSWLLFTSPVHAVERDIYFSTSVHSAWVWRGITFNRSPVLQAYLGVPIKKSFSAGVWASATTHGYEEIQSANEIAEIDVSLAYQKTLFSVETKVEYVKANYPGSASQSADRANVSLQVPLYSKLKAVVSYDYGFKGWLDNVEYSRAGLATDAIQLSPGGSLSASLIGAHWSDDYQSGFSHVEYKIAYSIKKFQLSVTHYDRQEESTLPDYQPARDAAPGVNGYDVSTVFNLSYTF